MYRAYLAQSHVFVGIYWQRYGWIALGMEIDPACQCRRQQRRHTRSPEAAFGARTLRRGDERVPQRVRLIRLGDPTTVGGPADDPGCALPAQPPAIGGQKTGPSLRSRGLRPAMALPESSH